MKITVIRFSSLGDCVLLCPFLEHLKQHGASEITVVTRRAFAEVFVAATAVDRVVALDEAAGWRGVRQIIEVLRDHKSVVIDAHNTLRSRIVSRAIGGAAARIEKYYAERLGLILFKRPARVRTMSGRYNALGEALGFPGMSSTTGGLCVPDAAAKRVSSWIDDNASEFVSIAPGSRWPMKRWGPEKFADLAVRIADSHGHRVIIVGDDRDKQSAEKITAALGDRAIDLTGRARIMETAAAIEKSVAFVGNDSGLMHLAEAVGVPVVALFGPTVEAFGYFPSLESSTVIERELSCRPCSRNGSRNCPKGTQECLTEIPVEPVEKAFEDLIEVRRPVDHATH